VPKKKKFYSIGWWPPLARGKGFIRSAPVSTEMLSGHLVSDNLSSPSSYFLLSLRRRKHFLNHPSLVRSGVNVIKLFTVVSCEFL
jgi:hypothetical protein